MSALLGTPPINPATRADILRRFHRDGQNTHEIGQALDLHEATVAEVLWAERERRVDAVEAISASEVSA